MVCSRFDKSPIEGVSLGNECLVDLRAWGWAWFNQLGLPDAERKIYVLKCEFLKWENKSKSRVFVSCPLFGQRFVWKNSDIMRYGMVTQLSDSMVLVDKVFCLSFPQVLGSD
jgi:hypothetical protein